MIKLVIEVPVAKLAALAAVLQDALRTNPLEHEVPGDGILKQPTNFSLASGAEDPIPGVAGDRGFVSPPAQNSEGVEDDAELDKNGLPWDERINTANRGKLKASGTWKVSPGRDPNFVKQVQDELRVKFPAPASPPAAPGPFETAQTTAPVAPPSVPAAGMSPPSTSWTAVFQLGNQLLSIPALAAPIRDLAARYGCLVVDAENPAGRVNFSLMAAQPDLIPEVLAALEALRNGAL